MGYWLHLFKTHCVLFASIYTTRGGLYGANLYSIAYRGLSWSARGAHLRPMHFPKRATAQDAHVTWSREMSHLSKISIFLQHFLKTSKCFILMLTPLQLLIPLDHVTYRNRAIVHKNLQDFLILMKGLLFVKGSNDLVICKNLFWLQCLMQYIRMRIVHSLYSCFAVYVLGIIHGLYHILIVVYGTTRVLFASAYTHGHTHPNSWKPCIIL